MHVIIISRRDYEATTIFLSSSSHVSSEKTHRIVIIIIYIHETVTFPSHRRSEITGHAAITISRIIDSIYIILLIGFCFIDRADYNNIIHTE